MGLDGLAGVYWLVPGRIAAGPHPATLADGSLKQALVQLRHLGVSSFVDLTLEAEVPDGDYQCLGAELARADKKNFHYRRFGIPDMQVPSKQRMADLAEYLAAELVAGSVVYLHCLAGLGRTGTVAACYLADRGLSGRQALAALTELRRGQGEYYPSPENRAQRQFVIRWADHSLLDE